MKLLDTDICVELLRGNKKVLKSFQKDHDISFISFMTVGELYYGVEKSKYPRRNGVIVDQFINALDIIESDREIMMQFGKLKGSISKIGRILPDADIMIAATAIMKSATLVTGNTSHFARFSELRLENWK